MVIGNLVISPKPKQWITETRENTEECDAWQRPEFRDIVTPDQSRVSWQYHGAVSDGWAFTLQICSRSEWGMLRPLSSSDATAATATASVLQKHRWLMTIHYRYLLVLVCKMFTNWWCGCQSNCPSMKIFADKCPSFRWRDHVYTLIYDVIVSWKCESLKVLVHKGDFYKEKALVGATSSNISMYIGVKYW